ncbi:MAG: complement resistance protein TraT [Nitrospira sp. BO4]|jgi:uncharacterized spore protein YtfJ|nr:complement resistance protein TraT [Nitrospira sp. BO4]
MSRLLTIPILALLLLTTACANHMTVNRISQAKSSTTIFLRPTNEKTIFLEARNTSDNPNATLSDLPARLTEKGYTLLQDPDKAHFIVQVTTVFAAKAKPGSTLDSLVAGGFGGAMGGAIGTAATLGSGKGFGWIPGGAAIGAAAGFIGSKVTEDDQLSIVADCQIIEKTKEMVEQVVSSQTTPGGGLPAPNNSLVSLFGGQSLSTPNAGQTTETTQEVHRGNERIHKSRYASMAQEMWMDQNAATADLVKRLTDSIAGLF